MFMRAPFVNIFESTDRQSVVSRVFVYCIAFNMGANLIFIPIYGMMGAAVATVITDCMIFSFLAFRGVTSGLYVSVAGISVQIIKVIASSAVMGIICYYSLSFGVVVSFIAAVLSYAFMLVLTGTLDRSDFELFRKALLK